MLQSVFDPTLFATSFMTLLVIQDPLGAVPIFLSLTGRQSPTERAASARQATWVSFWVILAFAVFGRYILKFLGISVPALQVAGGLLLLLVALELLTGKADESPDPDSVTANAALVPLGTPLLAGP
ncbi:MarC family protein, partial [Actinomyces slackii]